MPAFPSYDQSHRSLLQEIARKAMLAHGLEPEFPPAALTELDGIREPAPIPNAPGMRDLRELLWCSIDNDDSRDLDQLSVAVSLPGGKTQILVAVADVDSLVKPLTPIDAHANHNTTSVYTAARIFPMLPEKLSTDLTSLNHAEDRAAIVIEMGIQTDGAVLDSGISLGWVRNHAKLAYNSVAAWLDGNAAMPEAIAAVPGLADNLRLQDKIAQSMKNFRHIHGALSLETIQSRPVFAGDKVERLETEERNRAKEIIEDFMIAANGVTARYLAGKQLPSIRRVVRTPRRWDRIVEVAREHGAQLPGEPDAIALNQFLVRAKTSDPLRFPDLCLSIIKLMGAGEYVAEMPGSTPPGHFGLAVNDYAHSTAPNRRYGDLITQRMVKAALHGQPAPYKFDELDGLAQHFTAQEDAANKVERQVGKSAAALLLEQKIGEKFDAIVTGAADKGTWVRLPGFPVEGKLVQGREGLDVGQRLRVQLLSVDVEKGFIDFKRVGQAR